METKFKLRIPFMKNSKAAKASARAHHLRLGKDPYLDWSVILAAFLAMAVLGISFGLSIWHSVNSTSFTSVMLTSSAPASAVPSLNNSGLQDILTVQSEKASTAAQYDQGYPGPSDPSVQ